MKQRARLPGFLLIGAVVTLLLSITGTGVSSAQEHDHPGDPPDHGHPDPGDPDPGEPPDLGGRPEAERQSTVRYGPFSLPAAPDQPDGRHGHHHTGNLFQFGIEKPCSDCYITGMIPNLVDNSGNTVGIRDNLMLHHMVMFNQWDGREDATCGFGFPIPLGLLFGQRFFASGDERTPLVAQPGYGYYVGNGTWNMIYELMTMSQRPETVNIEVTFLWVPAAQAADMTDLEPVWFDIDQCSDSEVPMGAGKGTARWTWNVNRPGDIVGIGGHVHRGGINIEIRNDSTGRLICDSVAGYGETPLYIDHHGEPWVSSMSTCGGAVEPDFAAPVRQGERVTITGHYDHPEPVDDQMGIVIAYVARDEAEQCLPWDWTCWFR